MNVQPPPDLDDFRRRSHVIHEARKAAREEFKNQGLDESDADARYRIARGQKMAGFRADGKAQDEAIILADADVVVAEHKRDRDRAATLKRTAAYRIDECERGAATLNREAQMGEGIER